MSVDIVERLRHDAFVCHVGGLPRESKLLHDAADEIERLRKERDEARGIACDMFARRCTANRLTKARSYAQHMGWDCFKEGKQ